MTGRSLRLSEAPDSAPCSPARSLAPWFALYLHFQNAPSFPSLRLPSSSLLRQLGLPLRGVWALTSSELPWAVSDGPT